MRELIKTMEPLKTTGSIFRKVSTVWNEFRLFQTKRLSAWSAYSCCFLSLTERTFFWSFRIGDLFESCNMGTSLATASNSQSIVTCRLVFYSESSCNHVCGRLFPSFLRQIVSSLLQANKEKKESSLCYNHYQGCSYKTNLLSRLQVSWPLNDKAIACNTSRKDRWKNA